MTVWYYSHNLGLFALFVLFALRYSGLFAVRYSWLFAIRVFQTPESIPSLRPLIRLYLLQVLIKFWNTLKILLLKISISIKKLQGKTSKSKLLKNIKIKYLQVLVICGQQICLDFLILKYKIRQWPHRLYLPFHQRFCHSFQPCCWLTQAKEKFLRKRL